MRVLSCWCVLAAACGGSSSAALAVTDGGGAQVSAVDLGSAATGATSTAVLDVTNRGHAATGTLGLTISGDFALDDAATTCQGIVLAPGASCAIGIVFRPAAAGPRTGELVIASDPGGGISISLAGTGLTPMAALTVVRDGDGSGTVTSSPAGIDCGATCSAAFSGDVVLTATPDAGSVLAGWSAAGCAGATCTVTLGATPVTVTATFTHHDVHITPAVFDFGTVNTQSGPFGTLQLVNASSAAVSIDAMTASGPFAISGTTCGIALGAQASCDITVRLVSNTVGASSGTLDVTADGDHHTAQLVGTGELPIAVTVAGNGSVVSAPGGLACGATCTALFSGTATLTAVPAAGYVLGSWSLAACGSAASCDAAPGTSVTATFLPSSQPTLTVAFVGDATGQLRVDDRTQGTILAICTGSCTVPLAVGHTIEVVGATVSTYAGLTGACTASASVPSCQFQAAGAQTLATHFVKDPAEHWTRFVPAQAMQLAFDSAGNLLVIQAGSITKLAAATGAVAWSTQLAAQSFVVVPTGLYAGTGTNLVFVDASGVAGTPIPFTGAIAYLAPNGHLIGHSAGGVATEWDTAGNVVRMLPFDVQGIDGAGTFYQVVVTTADEGGTFVTRSLAHRWAFDGTALADIADVAPATPAATGFGFGVGAQHVVGYGCGSHIPQTRVFGYAAHAPDGSLEVSGGDSVMTFSDLICQAVPAGPNIGSIEGAVLPGGNGGYRTTIGWIVPSAGGWSGHAIVHPAFDDASYAVQLDVTPVQISGGPHGELVVVGTYTGLYNPMTGQFVGGGTYLQTFVP